jgi:DDE superfamily endonuclease
VIANKKGQDLSKEQKIENQQLAWLRIVVEHVYRVLKIFKILSSREIEEKDFHCA